MTKRIQLVNTSNAMLPRTHACEFCLFHRVPTECAKPEYNDCVNDSTSYYAEVDDDSPSN